MNQEWIDTFLQGRLSEMERSQLQQKLKKDANFATLLEEQQAIANGIRLARLSEQVRYFRGLNVLADGREVEEELIGEAIRVDKNVEMFERFRERGQQMDREVKLSSRRKWLGIAASILFLLGCSWYALFFDSKTQYELLAEKYNEPYPAFGITKGHKEELQRNQEQGLQLYTAGNYQEALFFLKKTFQTNKYNENSLYISICYLKTNQLDSAYIYLQNTPILLPELTDAARWYLAIYYLKREDLDKVIGELDLLTQSDALEIRRKAMALRKDIQDLKSSEK